MIIKAGQDLYLTVHSAKENTMPVISEIKKGQRVKITVEQIDDPEESNEPQNICITETVEEAY